MRTAEIEMHMDWFKSRTGLNFFLALFSLLLK